MNTKRLTKLSIAATGGILAVGGFAAPAFAYPPGTPVAFSVTPDGAVVVSQNAPACTVDVIVDGEVVGTITGDGSTEDGVAAPGQTVEIALGNGCDGETAQAPITVPGGDDDGDGGDGGGTDGDGSGGTPDTGAGNVTLGLVAALGALGIGGGLLVASRRKQV